MCTACRYTQSLSRRGLHRTALELCKLLLALNGDDPLGALCTIDYLALRAGRCACTAYLAARLLRYAAVLVLLPLLRCTLAKPCKPKWVLQPRPAGTTLLLAA